MKKYTLFFTMLLYGSQICCADSKDLIFRAQTQNIKKECKLGTLFLESAQRNNQMLKSVDPECFDTSVIKNSSKALKKLQELGGIPLTISSKTSSDIHGTFFDRHSDTLLVLGTGFVVQRERMLPFVKLFPNYDLLLFDYRGVGSNHRIDKSSRWKSRLSWKIAKVDFNISGLGTLEEEDVIDVVDAGKQQKDYAHVFGLGLCFSSYNFAKAAVKRPDLFDKLIFDGCWPSLERVIKTIIKNPSLLHSVEKPHSNLPCFTGLGWVQNRGLKLLEWLRGLNLHVPPLSYYLPQISCPILFFQSLNDCYCNPEEFEVLWSTVRSPKAAIFTNNLHGRNHVWQPEAYKEISQAFFEDSFDVFAKYFNEERTL